MSEFLSIAGIYSLIVLVVGLPLGILAALSDGQRRVRGCLLFLLVLAAIVTATSAAISAWICPPSEGFGFAGCSWEWSSLALLSALAFGAFLVATAIDLLARVWRRGSRGRKGH